MGRLSIIFIFVSFVMYPLWNVLLISTYVTLGDFSIVIFKLKSVFLLGMCGLFSFYSIANYRKLYLSFFLFYYLIILLLSNFVFSSKHTLYEIVLAFLPAFLLAVSVSFRGVFNSNVTEKNCLMLIQSGLAVFWITVLFGFFEKIFINDTTMVSLGYNILIGAAKGFDSMATYENPVPDNIYSFVSGLSYRRMVSFVGEPLYLAYFLFPFTFFYYVRLKRRKNIKNVFLFLVAVLALLLPLSRNVILGFIIAIIIYEMLFYSSQVYLKVGIGFIFLLGGGLALLFMFNSLVQSDPSLQGHFHSFTFFIDKLLGYGLLFPNENTVLSNILMISESGEKFIVESGLLIVISLLGVVGVFLFFGSFVSYFNYIWMYAKQNYHAVESNSNTFIVCLPGVWIGYVITAIFSPHILTFQLLFFIVSLSLLHFLITNNRENHEI